MSKLIALCKPQSNALVSEIFDIWNNGNAVAVLDPTFPAKYLKTMLDVLDPDVVVSEKKEHTLRNRVVDLPSDAALVIATSGTQGTPKAMVHTHTSLLTSALATANYLGVEKGNGQWLNALPLVHIGGFSTITKASFLELEINVLKRFDYSEIAKLAREKKTYMPIVRANLNHIDPSDFEALIIGGGRPPTNTPANAHVTYGLTETGSGCVYDGRPLEGVSIKISDIGEILISGDILAKCYRNGDPLVDEQGYFHTGDFGTLKNDQLSVKGRIADVIRSGGETIFPLDVEEIIASMSGISEVAIVGLDNDRFEQIPWAVVVPNTDRAVPSLDEIKNRVRNTLPHYCAPRGLTIVEKLPKTQLGKVRKKEIIQTLNNSVH